MVTHCQWREDYKYTPEKHVVFFNILLYTQQQSYRNSDLGGTKDEESF